jgi:hypothetical protein
MAPTITELFLAYRQAKIALYFERRGVGLIELAKFESQLTQRLSTLQNILAGNGGWFANIPIGEVYVVPKHLRNRPTSPNDVIRIGAAGREKVKHDLDIQLRLTPTPEFAIMEVLFLWRFGPALDSLQAPNSLGYRLDLRDGSLSRTRRWLFEYWPRRYQEFRTAPLNAARSELRRTDGSVVVLSADLESFYDTIDPTFMLQTSFVQQLVELPRADAAELDIDEYLTATRSLLSSYHAFRRTAALRTGLDWPTGVPIGALTSRIVANVSLITLDSTITARPDVVCYRRYVDDIVIVGRTSANDTASFDDTLLHFIPNASREGETFKLDVDALGRPKSDFRLRSRKIRIHHLTGIKGEDFIAAIGADFQRLVSERRAFLDTSVLLENAAENLIRAGKEGGPLRVLRDADQAKLEHFALSTTLQSLERVSTLVAPEEARGLAQRTLKRIGRFLAGEENWVESLELAFRLLRLGIGTHDWEESRELCNGMDAVWGTAEQLKKSAGVLFHRNRKVLSPRAWVSMRNYLHARRVETICTSLRPPPGTSIPIDWIQGGIRDRSGLLRSRALVNRARLLAAADLRARDREDDRFGYNPYDTNDEYSMFTSGDPALGRRIQNIKMFVDRCTALGDVAWTITPIRLFLCTRPPSYFDIARRWLYRTDFDGFDPRVFDELLELVNAVRGTAYQDPVGSVLDKSTVAIPASGGAGSLGASDTLRLILGNLVVSDEAFRSAATHCQGSRVGRPILTVGRLKGLTEVLSSATRAARQAYSTVIKPTSLLVLPELSVPRDWFRTVGNHVVQFGEFGLVAGLEYLHDPARPSVANQVYAIIPGPYSSVATWPWTKRLPARGEAKELASLQPAVSFEPPPLPAMPRTVVHSLYGRFSILICSELIESRRIADLLGRVELILAPSWNPDTASYDHLIQAVVLQSHAIIALANNGRYSDCRAWAPRSIRWERDLCRLIERDINDIVFVDIPLQSLRAFHSSSGLPADRGSRPEWYSLPPDWP